MLAEIIAGQKIAIVGAGVAGGYLYHMLRKAGASSVEIFSKTENTACGIHSCAWMADASIVDRLRLLDFKPENFIIGRYKKITINDRVENADIIVIDKPRLIIAFIAGATIKYEKPEISKYDRVIDATGAARALLPPAQRQHAVTAQCRVRANKSDIIEIVYIPKGYAWSVPIGRNHFHYGCGCSHHNPEQFIESSFDVSLKYAICSCRSEINITPPDSNLPFVKENIWGVGEAIGCVSPLFGDGILPSIESVSILLKHWNDADAYTSAILRNFERIRKEYKIFRAIEKSSPFALMRYPGIKNAFARYGINIKILDAINIMKRVMK